MATPCTNNPDEVISKVILAKDSADKFDAFVNGGSNDTVQLGTGAATPTIRNAVRQIMADATWAKQHIANAPEGDISLNNASTIGTSTSRTLAERFGDVVNVKDYGAVGNGVANDTTAFSSAVTAAEGKVLFIPSGTYNITDYIFCDDVSEVIDNGAYTQKKPVYPPKEIPITDLKHFRKVAVTEPYSNIVDDVQGLTYNSKTGKAISSLKTNDDLYQELHVVDIATGETTQKYTYEWAGHVNTLAYCAEQNKLYAQKFYGTENDVLYSDFVVLNGDTMQVLETKRITGYNLSCLSYDKVCKFFVGTCTRTDGKHKYVIFDLDFNVIREFEVDTNPDTTNGACCYNGVIYQITFHYIRFISCLGYLVKQIEYTGEGEFEDIDAINDEEFILNSYPSFFLYKYDKKYECPSDNLNSIENSTYTISNVDLDTLFAAGWFRVSSSTATAHHFPTGAFTNGLLHVFHYRHGFYQVIYRVSDSNYNEIFIRLYRRDIGYWHPWRRIDNAVSLNTQTIDWRGAGYLSYDKTRIDFTMPLTRDASYNVTPVINSGALKVRYEGQYIYNGSITDNSISIAYQIDATGIIFYVSKSDGGEWYSTNNICVGVELEDMSITFNGAS